MKLYEATTVIILIFVCLGLVIGVGNTLYDAYWPDDNLMEEHVEEKINEHTGYDIDLTPKSIEKLYA